MPGTPDVSELLAALDGISAQMARAQTATVNEPMRQQMAIALKRLEEQERRARGRYQPILFVVAVCKADAEKAEQTLSNYFKVQTLLVTEDSEEADRKKAQELGKRQKSGKPIKAVVSVLMLREGWDVPEVGVILLLRKFGSVKRLRKATVDEIASTEGIGRRLAEEVHRFLQRH